MAATGEDSLAAEIKVMEKVEGYCWGGAPFEFFWKTVKSFQLTGA